MKIGQLIKYNKRNIFFEKPYAQYGGKTSPQPFFKIEHISGSTAWNFMQSVFFVCLSRELPKHNEANLLMTCFYLIRIFFKKQKKSGTSLHVLFTARFFKKNIYHVTFFQLT